MPSHNTNQLHQVKNYGLMLLIGAAAGYVASLFVSASTRTKQKEAIEDVAERVTDVFEENTAKVRAKYFQVKNNLTTSIENLMETVGEIDKEKYQQEVDKVLDQARRDKLLIKREAEKLKNYFMQDYEKIRGSFESETQAGGQ
jgi:phage I-like protein